MNHSHQRDQALLIEQLPKLVAEQVNTVQGFKIDTITVWDQGSGANGTGRNATANFLSGMIGSLPRLHKLAQQAGIELPSALGKLNRQAGADGHISPDSESNGKAEPKRRTQRNEERLNDAPGDRIASNLPDIPRVTTPIKPLPSRPLHSLDARNNCRPHAHADRLDHRRRAP